MHPELSLLFEKATGELGRGAHLVPSSTVIVRNDHPVGGKLNTSVDFDTSTGFHFLTIGEDHKAQYYCKVGSAADQHLRRECDVLSRLRADESWKPFLPRVGSAASDAMLLQVCDYLGPSIQRRAACMTGRERRSLYQTVLETHATLGDVASTIPEVTTAAGSVSILEEASWAFSVLESVLSDDQRTSVQRVLANGGDVSPVPQHGDFWLGNIVGRGLSWGMVDFATFGIVRVPLYDALHFVSHLIADFTPTGSRESWFLHCRNPKTKEVALCLNELENQIARLSLSTAQLTALVFFYLLDFTARIRERNLEFGRIQPEPRRRVVLERISSVYKPYLKSINLALNTYKREGRILSFT